MKEYEFIAGCRRGKWDTGESYVSVELTDEEAKALEFYGKQEDILCSANGFAECEELKELYNKVYKIAVDQMTQEFRDCATEENIEADGANNPSWKIDDSYCCEVFFPWALDN